MMTNNKQLHVLWINDKAENTGGCESYIQQTVKLLRSDGIKQSFLYNVNSSTDKHYLEAFDESYPLVDIHLQIREINPDIVYIHNLNEAKQLDKIIETGVPTMRFFHDHHLFCLREHKYKTITHKTCTQTMGLGCYSCLGFINRSNHFPGIRLRHLYEIKKEQNINRRLGAYIVGSHYMAEHLKAYGFDENKIHVNPLFTTENNRDNIECIPRSNQLLFVGQLVQGKGLDILLRAMSLSSVDVELLVVGSGKQEKNLKSIIELLGLSKRVHFLGKKNTEELSQIYQQSSCVVVPSRAPETFCLVGIEAMSHGKPVISSHCGGVEEWLIPEKTGCLVPPNDEHALARAIDKLFNRPDLLKEMGHTAFLEYKKRFRPLTHIKNLKILFDSLVPSNIKKEAII